jgi:predicted Zn-dependent protease
MSLVKLSKNVISRFSTGLVTLAVSLSSVAQDQRIDLPDMGASADTIISRADEAEYAKALVRQMRAYEVLNEDPLIHDYFEDMGYRLAAVSDRPDKPFTFVVINQDIVNAFAAPGGVIALYSGLILAADDESEVAAVLAHEIAHITQQHLYRAIENQQAMTIPLALAMLGLVLVGGGSAEAVQGALLGGQAAAVQAQINFTRQNEVEADRIGIRTLSLAGYDPAGMYEFFEKMGRITRSMGEGPPEFLRTHPVSVSRITEAKNRAENMPMPQDLNELNFYLAQARLRALVEQYPDKTLEWFNHRLERADVGEEESDALYYGSAISLQRKGDYAEARILLDSLMARRQHLAYELQLADLDLDSGRDEAALDRLGGLYHNFPGNHAISMQYGRALLKSGDTEQAETASVILRQQLLNRPEDPTLHELYAQASNAAGDTVRARESMAEAYYLRGNIHEAVLQLQKLEQLQDLNYYERARITHRLNELRLELAQMEVEK